MANGSPQPRSSLIVECLSCGTRREVVGVTCDEIGVCPCCSYVGWALASELSEGERRSLLAVPPAVRPGRYFSLG
jgi:hypothetical protein